MDSGMTRKQWILAVGVFLFIVFVIPWGFTRTIEGLPGFLDTGPIGDTIGGLTAPFINGISAILVYLAFRSQYRANEIFIGLEKNRNKRDDYFGLVNNASKMNSNLGQLLNSLKVRGRSYKSTANHLSKEINELLIFFYDFNFLFRELMDQREKDKELMQRMAHLYNTYFFEPIEDMHTIYSKTGTAQKMSESFEIIRLVDLVNKARNNYQIWRNKVEGEFRGLELV